MPNLEIDLGRDVEIDIPHVDLYGRLAGLDGAAGGDGEGDESN
jgi:hypothetical protein